MERIKRMFFINPWKFLLLLLISSRTWFRCHSFQPRSNHGCNNGSCSIPFLFSRNQCSRCVNQHQTYPQSGWIHPRSSSVKLNNEQSPNNNNNSQENNNNSWNPFRTLAAEVTDFFQSLFATDKEEKEPPNTNDTLQPWMVQDMTNEPVVVPVDPKELAARALLEYRLQLVAQERRRKELSGKKEPPLKETISIMAQKNDDHKPNKEVSSVRDTKERVDQKEMAARALLQYRLQLVAKERWMRRKEAKITSEKEPIAQSKETIPILTSNVSVGLETEQEDKQDVRQQVESATNTDSINNEIAVEMPQTSDRDISDEDWEASIRLAQDSLDGNIVIPIHEEAIDRYEEVHRDPDKASKTMPSDKPGEKKTINVSEAARKAVEEYENLFNKKVGKTSEKPKIDKERKKNEYKSDSKLKDAVKWEKMSIVELKNELEKRSLKRSGKKKDLIARLQEYDVKDAMKPLETHQDRPTPDVSETIATSSQTTDWSKLTVAALKKELRSRNLPTAGRKHDLIVLLERDDAKSTHESTQPDDQRKEYEESEAVAIEDFSKMTVAMLKQQLRDRGLPVSGNKSELISRLENASKNTVLAVEHVNDVQINGGVLESMNAFEFSDDIAKAARQAVDIFETQGKKDGKYNAAIDEQKVDEVDDVTQNAADDFVDELDFGEFNLELLTGVPSRETDLFFQEEEPSDEALWEIENEVVPLLMTESFSEHEDEEPIKTTDYESMAVSELKEELRRRGLRVTGKKNNLIDRLRESDF